MNDAIPPRRGYATVAQLRDVLNSLRQDDLIVVNHVGNLAIVRDGQDYATITLACSNPDAWRLPEHLTPLGGFPPSAELEIWGEEDEVL